MQFSSRICSPLTLCPLALPFNSSFCCLLFLLHPLPRRLSTASSSSLQPPPILSSYALPPENEKFSEIQMCPASDKDWKWVWVSSIVSSTQASIDAPPPLTRRTHIYYCCIISHPTALSSHACVSPVVLACIFITQTLCMCYRRSAINLLVPWELCCVRE